MKRYILTGGGCTGKTTLLEHFANKGYVTLPETARAVIAHELHQEQSDSTYTGMLPWTHPVEFQHKVFAQQTALERQRYPVLEVFMDRSIIDSVPYMENAGMDLEPLYTHVRSTKYATAFFLEQLPIYEKDEERKEDLEFALDIHNRIYDAYKRLEVEIIRIPAVSVDERAQLILDHINTQ